MKFIRAIHTFDDDNRMITFGTDTAGKTWLVIDADTRAPVYRGPFANLAGFAAGLSALTEKSNHD